MRAVLKPLASSALLLTALLALPACGEDPVLKAAREEAEQGAKPPSGDPSAQAPGKPGVPAPGDAGAPAPGIPEEPKPGRPDEPAPGGPGPGGAAGIIPPPEGPTVTVRGTVQLPDWQSGRIAIDVFDGDNRMMGGERPKIVGRMLIDEPGPFELKAPKDSKIWLSAYNDADDNLRPSQDEAMGSYEDNPVDTSKDRTGVSITLSLNPSP